MDSEEDKIENVVESMLKLEEIKRIIIEDIKDAQNLSTIKNELQYHLNKLKESDS